MRLLISWLRDFVDVPRSGAEIAERLELCGFEVASVEAVDAGDTVIDFEITANRPDCLSVLGLAREVATAYDLPLRQAWTGPAAGIRLPPPTSGELDRLTVAVEDAELCPRYAAAVVEVSSVPSPEWMTRRLRAAGVRPLGAVVDVTNYVLLDLGHPLHAFDLGRLAGPALRIRRAKPGETITTLDGVTRTLDAEMLVIADADRAQAVAGVMGGASSEVSAATRLVVIESAYFKPASVRRTSKRLGLKTEASSRFERGTDPNAPVVALERALALLETTGAGRAVGPIVDRYPHRREAVRLHLRRPRLARLLGTTVSDGQVERILRGLGLAVTPEGDGWNVVAPTFRVDLAREADLVEEVGRHYGFNRIDPTFPVIPAPPPPPDPRIPRDRLVRQILTAAGLSEAVTFGFVETRAAQAFADAASLIALDNPLSAKFDMLRPSLLPGLIDSIGHNRRHGRRDVALFEIGTRFLVPAGETRAVAAAWTGAAEGDHWTGRGREVDFFDVKGLVEALCSALDVPIRFQAIREAFLVPGQSAAIAAASTTGARLGILGQLDPAIAERRGLPHQDRVLVAELDLDALWCARIPAHETATSLPRHPSIVRDLSIIVADTLPAETISGTIQATARTAIAPLVGVGFFDRYQGKGVPDGRVSVSLRLTFQAPDRTLTDEEVQGSFDLILAALAHEHGAVQR